MAAKEYIAIPIGVSLVRSNQGLCCIRFRIAAGVTLEAMLTAEQVGLCMTGMSDVPAQLVLRNVKLINMREEDDG